MGKGLLALGNNALCPGGLACKMLCAILHMRKSTDTVKGFGLFLDDNLLP